MKTRNSKNLKVIIITGTPCTGKTTLAKKLSHKLGYKLISCKFIISKHNLADAYDDQMRCKVVDIKKLNKYLIGLIMDTDKYNKKNKSDGINGLVIESHLSHYLPKKYVDLCVVTKCNLHVLKKRLEKRGYSDKKVRENLDCEIFDVCLSEAKEINHICIVVDTTKCYNISYLIKKFK
ncbi:MAG: adenylate kinase family protein [Candidatus Woesearchaeota archaeon]